MKATSESKILQTIVIILFMCLLIGCTSEKKIELPYYGAFTNVNNDIVEIDMYMGEPLANRLTFSNLVELDFQEQGIYLWWAEIDFDTLFMISMDNHSGFIDYVVTPLENDVFQIKPRDYLQPGIYCLAQGGYLMSPVDIPYWCFQAAVPLPLR